ncbi:unnamed protein product (mitochondrion) [Plasmodiophora brassicae]|uniref:Uncharacterized protein n=1 Tax=Plasmodiophora brassicae TaxID=37360 RepID=A0A0G4IVY8_PLABS|nr:hypothetical protein PBRA_001200 [Plasmodiophora brassicae]SPQ97311.1 unnamed protein product [Plasmodiophora brassicae]
MDADVPLLLGALPDRSIALAAAWLSDAMHFRPHSPRIASTPQRLRCYVALHSRPARAAVLLAIIVHLLVPILNDHLQDRAAVLVACHVYIVAVYAARTSAQAYTMPHRLVHDLVAGAVLVDLAVAIVVPGSSRASSYIAPVIIADTYPSIRSCLRSLRQSLIAVRPYIELLAAHVVVSAAIACLLLSDHNRHFASLGASLLSTMYLLTAVNYPGTWHPPPDPATSSLM